MASGPLNARTRRGSGRRPAGFLALAGTLGLLAVLVAWLPAAGPATTATRSSPSQREATDRPARAAASPSASNGPAAQPPNEPAAGPAASAVARGFDPAFRHGLIRTIGPTPPEYLTGYQWPIDHARITNAFGIGRPGSFLLDGRMVHDGIDLSTFCGDRVVAAHDGVVLVAGRHYEGFVGWIGSLDAFRARMDAKNAWRSRAIAVVVDDGNGYRSVYVHLRHTVVKAGDAIRAGQLIGYEGETGHATGCHLHYALFSPLERATFGLDPDVVKRLRLPDRVTARVDPLLVLPPLEDASITWGWGAGGP